MRENLVFGVFDGPDGEREVLGGGEVLTGKGGAGECLEPFDGLGWVPGGEEET